MSLQMVRAVQKNIFALSMKSSFNFAWEKNVIDKALSTSGRHAIYKEKRERSLQVQDN